MALPANLDVKVMSDRTQTIRESVRDVQTELLLAIGLVVASGIVYSLGAAVYALKRPNPFPRVFGYHEVFHAFVVAASVLLFVHVDPFHFMFNRDWKCMYWRRPRNCHYL